MRLWKRGAGLLMLAAVQVALFACGGGGGGSGSVTPPVVTQTRALKAGDTFTYDLTGQMEISGQTYPYSGSSTFTVTQETINGDAVIAATDVMGYTLNGTNYSGTAVAYYQHDPVNGALLAYGQQIGTGPVITVTDRPLPAVWPASWEANTVVTVTIHYNDGSSDSHSLGIISQESVTTPAGTYSAWKCFETTGPTVTTVWFSPQLGTYVKMDNGTATYTLRSTNITTP